MYILEGNNGIGKSTLLKLIQKNLPHVEALQEPVDVWAKEHNNEDSLLARFYANAPRWAYTMETYTMIARVQEHLKAQHNPSPFKIMERSLYSGHYCFARNGYEQGFMTEMEWTIYNKWFKFLVPQKCEAPKGFIYIQSDPEVCFERSAQRNRKGEEAVPLKYFEQMHDQHERYLLNKENVLESLKDVPVLVLDGNEEFETNPDVQQNHFEKIEEFLLAQGPTPLSSNQSKRSTV